MWTENIEGRLVRLRIADENDAEFTLGVRQDAKNTLYMPSINVSLAQQKKWIRDQIESEDCYFFVIERLSGERIGTFSIYNIVDKKSAETGRLTMTGNQIELIETYILFHEFGFCNLGIKYLYGLIETDNNPALGFALRTGAEVHRRFINDKTGKEEVEMGGFVEDFYKVKPGLVKLIDRFADRYKKEKL